MPLWKKDFTVLALRPALIHLGANDIRAMTARDLIHRKLLFDPDLDFENLPELPGKQVMSDLREIMARDQIVCSELIQDSHGWCFDIRGADSRNYLLELIPVCTEAENSEWVLHCSRCMGLRFWELARDNHRALGSEQQCLDKAVAILVSQFGFENLQQST